MAEHSQVVNNVNIIDLSMRYSFNSQTSLSVGLPYLTANRDGALRNAEGHVIARYTRSQDRRAGRRHGGRQAPALGPGDPSPLEPLLGLGIKAPTGDYKQRQRDAVCSAAARSCAATGALADYSVQPGDGCPGGSSPRPAAYRILNKTGSLALYG